MLVANGQGTQSCSKSLLSAQKCLGLALLHPSRTNPVSDSGGRKGCCASALCLYFFLGSRVNFAHNPDNFPPPHPSYTSVTIDPERRRDTVAITLLLRGTGRRPSADQTGICFPWMMRLWTLESVLYNAAASKT